LDIIKKEQYLRGVLLLWIAASLPTRYANAIIFLNFYATACPPDKTGRRTRVFNLSVRLSIRPFVCRC